MSSAALLGTAPSGGSAAVPPAIFAAQADGASRGGKTLRRRLLVAAPLLLGGLGLLASSSGRSALGSGVIFLASAPAAPQYTKVQYLGFNLFTAPGTTADGCTGAEADLSQCYLGSKSVRRDIERRQEIMEEAIERAYQSAHWDRSPQTLKVWLAPEFYWRGARGAYRMDGDVESVARSTVASTFDLLAGKKFENWLFVMGTIVTAEETDPRWVRSVPTPDSWNISYYNFAPIHVGGTQKTYLKFKQFISGIDFLQTTPNAERKFDVQAAPGSGSSFCKRHPDSNACMYGTMPRHLLDKFGFGQFTVMHDHVLEVGGLRIGLEICLDHALSQLCDEIAPGGTVDVQLVVSAGMNIASGAVCTRARGPTFLADGFARTEANFNIFGDGRHSEVLPDGHTRRFNTGIVYGADDSVSMQQWIADTIADYTGTGFGTRMAGEGTLPGGSKSSGSTGITFEQVSALGDDWEEQLVGFYDVANYKAATHIDEFLEEHIASRLRRENRSLPNIPRPHAHPTVDIYGPVPLAPA